MTSATEHSSDFINEMYVAVPEGCTLWELAAGATDMEPDGRVVHGPWEPHQCSAVITRWLDNGWVELHLDVVPAGWNWNLQPAEWQRRAQQRAAFLVLAEGDARHLLQDPQRWAVGTADGMVCLSISDAGRATDLKGWAAAATAP